MISLKIGVTGTKQGMTQYQCVALEELIASINAATNNVSFIELHHGDCKGVDDEVATKFYFELHHRIHYSVYSHPPDNAKHRAYNKAPCDEYHVLPELPYLERDRKIVDDTGFLIVIPQQMKMVIRGSGTWYTARYAVKQSKPITIIQPDGKTRTTL